MIDITLSREEIRKQLLQYYAKVLEIEESQLDLSDTSFSSFVINSLSALASNTLVYGSLVYNESSLVTAQLPESIINWARYLDYTPRSATEATVDVLIKIPLTGQFRTIISKDHKFYANEIPFIPKYEYVIDTTSGISISRIEDVPIPIPFSVINEDDQDYLAFTIPVYQEVTIEEEFTVPTLKSYEFFSQTINIKDGYVIDVKVIIDNEEWSPGRIIFAEPNEKVFEWVVLEDKLKIMFGNDLVGKQPHGIVKVYITLTKGSAGNVGPGTITKGDPLYTDETPPTRVDYKVNNIVGASGGSDLEQLVDIKRNAPRSLSMLKRVVSSTDYNNIFKIIYGEDTKVIPILKRSDIAINDVLLYTTITWNDELVPTTSIYIPYDNTIDQYGMYTTFNFEGEEWICPFLLEVDHTNQIVYYRYIPEDMPLNIYTSVRTDTAQVTLVSGKVLYDYTTDEFTIRFNLVTLDDTLTITQKINVIYQDTIVEYLPTNVSNPLPNLHIFEYVIPRNDLKGFKSIDIYTYQNSEFVLLDNTTFEEIDLSKVSTSQIYQQQSDEQFIITDIPVILKSWWDTLSDDDKKAFTFYIVSRMLSYESNTENRMMNVNISVKFAKTYGKLNNLQYSKPDYIVKGIVNSYSEVGTPALGDMYAISDPIDERDPWYPYAGYLAVWGGTEWTLFKPGRGTLIRTSEIKNIEYPNTYIYVATGNPYAGIKIYDIGDINNITQIGSVPTNAPICVVNSTETRLWSITGNTLELFDITDKTNPTRINSTTIDSNSSNLILSPDETKLYISYSFTAKIAIYDATDDSLTKIMDYIPPVATEYVDISKDGSTLYNISWWYSRLAITDLTQQPPVPIATSSQFTNETRQIAVNRQNTHVYVSHTGNIDIVDVTDKTNPTIIGSVSEAGKYLLKLETANTKDLLIALDGNSSQELFIYDISDPTNPTLLSQIYLSSDVNNYVISSDENYIITAGPYSTFIIDISDPTNPYVVQSISGAGTGVSVRTIDTTTSTYKVDTIYSTDGRRWFIPDYNNPLDINIEVFTTSYSGNIYNAVLDTVLQYVNEETGIEESIYMSKLTDKIHNISGVNWVRIVHPPADIIYRDTYKDLTRDQLAKYVPEYAYTDAEHVKITLNVGR